MTPGESLAARIRDRYDKFLERQVKPQASYPTNRASQMGHPCLRFLVLSRTAGEKAKLVGKTTAAIFREGRIHERDVRMVLAEECDIGVHGAEKQFPPNDYLLTGHVDAELYEENTYGKGLVKVGLEIKSINPEHWARINDAKDMLDPRFPRWVRQWYSQSQLYMFLGDCTEWLYILKNKLTGAWKVLVSDLDWDHVAECVDKADAVNKHVDEGTLPEPIRDPSVCRRCKFNGTACLPPPVAGPGLLTLNEPEVVDLARQVLDNQQAGFTHQWARKRLSEIVKAVAGVTRRPIVAGDVMIQVSPRGAKAITMTVRALAGTQEDDENGDT